jgi:type IV secretory pathway VirB2 component (pilin)
MARRLVTFWTLALLTLPRVAAAGPGRGGPLAGFGSTILGFLTGTLGPVVFGLGIAAAAISMIVGSREGLQKALWAIVGGGLLFSVDLVTSFVQGAAN